MGPKELDTTHWLNNNNPTHIHLWPSKRNFGNQNDLLSLSTFFFVVVATIYRENWSILSKLLHRPQSGKALWARVFLNTGNSWMYSWVKSTKGYQIKDFPGGPSDKELPCQCRRCSFDPWVRNIPWRREWQPTPVSLPGESHGEWSLVADSPWVHKEWTTTEWLKIGTCLVNEFWAELTFPFRAGAPNL